MLTTVNYVSTNYNEYPIINQGKQGRNMKSKAFKAAFPYTLPICIGFLFLGMSYGFLMRSKGFSFLYPMFMILFIFAGSMEFVTVNLLLSSFHLLHAFFLALMVNARHLFYGISMLQKYQNVGTRVANLAGKSRDGYVGVHHVVPDWACPSRNLYPAATSSMSGSGQIYSSFRFANVFTFV
mgnify:CR=1 FL=1